MFFGLILKLELSQISTEISALNIRLSIPKLVISYVGYTTDTITVTNPNTLCKTCVEDPKELLDEVILTSRIKATSKSYLKAENVINISSAELLKGGVL